MTIRKMTSSFRYSGLVLPDPAPDLDVESVRFIVFGQLSRNHYGCAHGTGGCGRHTRLHLHEAIGTKG